MKPVLSAVVVFCLFGMLSAEVRAQPLETRLTNKEHHLRKRYAESIIASDISKIMDSMMQKNFVDFLLKQREKKNEPAIRGEGPDGEYQYNELLKLKMFMKNMKIS